MSTETYANPIPVAAAEASERALFIRRTYMHVALAILGFIGLTSILWRFEPAVSLASSLTLNPLIFLGLWIGISMLANKMAYSRSSKAVQYGGLALYTVLVSIMFLPAMMYAHYAPQFVDKAILSKAAFMTLSLFVGLTAVALVTRKDFSFLQPILMIGGFIALGLIGCSLIFGLDLGTWFAFAMVIMMAGSILHTTSGMLRQYPADMYVGAALSLFSSIALMFWYILQIFMNRD